jgi:hypothetical protein
VHKSACDVVDVLQAAKDMELSPAVVMPVGPGTKQGAQNYAWMQNGVYSVKNTPSAPSSCMLKKMVGLSSGIALAVILSHLLCKL